MTGRVARSAPALTRMPMHEHTPPPSDKPTDRPMPTPSLHGLRGVFADAWQRVPSDAVFSPGGQGGPGALVLLADPAAWQPWQHDALALLDAAQRQRVQRMHRDSDRAVLAIAYALHRLVLGAVLRLHPSDVPLQRDARGAPRLPGTGLHTSLGHVERCVAIAISHAGVVGVDVEPLSRAAQMPEIAAQVQHPDEVRTATRGDGAAAALLQLWVRKEALLKAAGVGLAVPMPGFVAPAGVRLSLPAEDAAPTSAGPLQPSAGATIHMLDAGPEWIVAVAGVGLARAPACAWLEPPQR